MRERLGIAAGILGFIVLSWLCGQHDVLSQSMTDKTATVPAPPSVAVPETSPPAEAPTPVSPAVTETAPSPVVPTAPQIPPPSLEARLENGIVTLSGVVPDENTKTKILTRATEVYGAEKFTDNLKVGNIAADAVSFESGDWTTRVLALLPFVNRAGENSKLTISGNTVALIGQVGSEETRAALRQALSSAAGDTWNVAESIIVEASPSPSPSPPTTSEAKLQPTTDHAPEGKIVEFFMGSDVITPKGRAVLHSLVALLRRSPDAQIEIAGHTDNVGTEEYNQALSQRRADGVRRYFIGRGIAADRITTQAYGSARPVADNSTVEGRWRNRRAEIVIRSAAIAGN